MYGIPKLRKNPSRHRLLFSLCLFLLMACLPLSAAAKEDAWNIALSDTQGYTNDTFTAAITLTGGETLSSVLLRAEYDPQVLSCTKITFCDTVEKYSRTLLEEGSVKGVFTCHAGQSIPQNASLAVFRFTFTGTAAAETEVTFFAEQLTAPDGYLLSQTLQQSFSVRLLTKDPTAALLSSLFCADGVLSPAFSPDIFDYTMQVPFSVTSIDFTAIPLHGDATVLQMKHSLGAGGSENLIRIKVTGADAVTRQQYSVTVLRLPKGTASPKPTKTPKPTQTPKPTLSPKPTRTPKPTLTHNPTRTPKPVSSETSVSSFVVSSQSPSSAGEFVSSVPDRSTSSAVISSEPIRSSLPESSGQPPHNVFLLTARTGQTETAPPVVRLLSSREGFMQYLVFLAGAAGCLLLLLLPVYLLQKKKQK